MNTRQGVIVAWKTISTGGGTAEGLLTSVVSSCEEVSSNAKFLMGKITITPVASTVDLVVLTPRDLGFVSNPRTDAFLTKKFCTQWSSQNLDGCVIELCEAEDGPRLRDQYPDQPNGETLWMAMERMTDSGGYPVVFGVWRNGDGHRWLSMLWARPHVQWPLDDRIVFRFRKLPMPLVA